MLFSALHCTMSRYLNSSSLLCLKDTCQISTEKSQYSKLLSDLPPVDVVITMGCNVQCPMLPCSHREDWGLDDPSGKPDEAFLETMDRI